MRLILHVSPGITPASSRDTIRIHSSRSRAAAQSTCRSLARDLLAGRRVDYRLDGSGPRLAQEDSVFDYDLPAPSARARELQDRMVTFMRERVLPAEGEYLAYRRAAGPDGHVVPPVVEELKKQAQA